MSAPVDPREPVTQAERDEFEALDAQVRAAGRVLTELGGVGQLAVATPSDGDVEAVARWMYLADRILCADQPVMWAALRARMPRATPVVPTAVQFSDRPTP